MNINDFYGAGSDIVDAVNEAVSKNDFSALSSTIKKTVKEVSDTIQRDVREYNEKNKREDVRNRTYRNTAGQGGARSYGNNPYRRYQKPATGAASRGMNSEPVQPRKYTSQRTPFFQKLVSKQPGLAKIIGGICGMFVCVPMLLGNLANLVADKAKELAHSLGRKVTPAELAGEGEVTQEQIRDATRLTGRAIEDLDT